MHNVTAGQQPAVSLFVIGIHMHNNHLHHLKQLEAESIFILR
jgi:hypothetical protein